jgi:hypothetical protein
MMDRKKESIEKRLVTRLRVAEEVEGQKEWTVFCGLGDDGGLEEGRKSVWREKLPVIK